MSKKFDKDLLELDLYDILKVQIDASEKEIKKSFRAKALACHPDKNPNNPNAADEFNRLKKILEIFLDSGTRSAYDKVLKGRRAAAERAKSANLKSRKLKSDLEERERASRLHEEFNKLSEEERLKREIKRLEEEGEKLIEEEIENLNREAEEQIKRAFMPKNTSTKSYQNANCRVKARWRSTDEWEGYSEEEIQQLFYKWGEINAVVMKKKGTKHTALIEFKTQSGANMAIQFEKGLIGKPVEVTLCGEEREKGKEAQRAYSAKEEKDLKTTRDFESLSSMNKRREAERKKLIQQMMSEDV